MLSLKKTKKEVQYIFCNKSTVLCNVSLCNVIALLILLKKANSYKQETLIKQVFVQEML